MFSLQNKNIILNCICLTPPPTPNSITDWSSTSFIGSWEQPIRNQYCHAFYIKHLHVHLLLSTICHIHYKCMEKPENEDIVYIYILNTLNVTGTVAQIESKHWWWQNIKMVLQSSVNESPFSSWEATGSHNWAASTLGYEAKCVCPRPTAKNIHARTNPL